MPSQRSRNLWVKVRVNESEREQYQRMAADADMPLSDLIRQRMEQPIVAAPRAKQRRLRTVKADPELLRQLAAMGNNLNQLARSVNRHGLRPDDALMLLTYLTGIQNELRLLREQSETMGDVNAP